MAWNYSAISYYIVLKGSQGLLTATIHDSVNTSIDMIHIMREILYILSYQDPHQFTLRLVLHCLWKLAMPHFVIILLHMLKSHWLGYASGSVAIKFQDCTSTDLYMCFIFTTGDSLAVSVEPCKPHFKFFVGLHIWLLP